VTTKTATPDDDNPNSKGKDKRRSRGDGGLYWSEARQCWIAEVTVGYQPNGRRITRKGSGKTKTAAKDRLKELLRDYEDGVTMAADAANYTVKDAVEDWLKYGLPGRSPATREKAAIIAHVRVIPDLGARKLQQLTTRDVDQWLERKAQTLSTSSIREARAVLRRAVARAQAQDRVRRNVVELAEIPDGQDGRPSKSLTFAQAQAVLKASEQSPLHAYIVVSLLTGARTEEMRSLRWDHVDLIGAPDTDPPIPPHVMVWRSVRAKNETKTRKSRRTLALPARAVNALKRHGETQNLWRAQTDRGWSEDDLVFVSEEGTALDPANVRRQFRAVANRAGLKGSEWTPRELRHSFVSLLSDRGVPTEQISLLVGHSGTSVTETVYRHQIRPVIRHGAQVMDEIFPESGAA
jgi:integrase